MLVVLPSQQNALLVATGYKAGLVPQVLPPEAGPTGALDRDWLIANWTKWVFPTDTGSARPCHSGLSFTGP